MALKNRVDPWGELNAVSSKAATLMGNRGILHDEKNQIVRPWKHKGWVTCLLSYKELPRPKPFSLGNYSELFFLDEATAFAAGHRPCAYCQRTRHLLFKEAWRRARIADNETAPEKMPEIDKILHVERMAPGGGKAVVDTKLSALPFGSMFEYEGKAFLVGENGCFPWSFDGYGDQVTIDGSTTVGLLTPKSIVRAFAAGFRPSVHLTMNSQ